MPAYIFTVTRHGDSIDDETLAKLSARVIADNMSDAMRVFAVNRRDIRPPFKVSVHVDRYEEMKTTPTPIPRRG